MVVEVVPEIKMVYILPACKTTGMFNKTVLDPEAESEKVLAELTSI